MIEIKMIKPLDIWILKVLEKLDLMSSKTQGLYSKQGNLAHYHTVADLLDCAFKDDSLTKAGFLHGMQLDEVKQECFELINEDILRTLEGLEQINSFDPLDPSIGQQIVLNVLPTRSDHNAAYIFLIENLHHIDPERKLLEWTQNFVNSPTIYPVSNLKIHFFSKTLKQDNAKNLCSVYSKIAEFLHMWIERNCFDNASLIFENKDRFQKLVDFCIRMSSEEGPCIRQVNIIKKSLATLAQNNIHGVHWEWRHVGTLTKKIPIDDERPWERFLYNCGFVTIVCKNEDLKYQVLSRLHRDFGFRANKVQFYRNWIDKSIEYSAIHTHLEPTKALFQYCEAIPVRILVYNSAYHHRNMSVSEICDHDKSTSISIENFDILNTFTPDGKLIKMPLGSTVLNFAHALHNTNVIKLKSSIVNGKPIDDIFYQISNGDVIYLKFSDSPLLLPNDWETKIPQQTVFEINKSYKQYIRPFLRKIGSEWIVQQLQENNVDCPSDGETIHSIIREVDKYLSKLKCKHPPTNKENWNKPHSEWWVQQFGIYVTKEIQGYKIPHSMEIDDNTIKIFLIELSKLVNILNVDFINELEIPEESLSIISTISYCNNCTPSINEELVGTITNNNLTLHRPYSPCARGGFIVSQKYNLPKPNHFFLKTKNRTGIGSEILTVFSKFRIDIIEMVGIRINAKFGIFRIITGFIDSQRLSNIKTSLTNILGVDKLYPPGMKPESFIEAILPPKYGFGTYHKPAAPYTLGDIIRTDYKFYGMETEKSILRDSLRTVLRYNYNKSVTCFIHGPKRIGKSSLSKSFIRSVRALYDDLFEVSWEAPLYRNWSKVKDAFYEHLKFSINKYFEKHNIQMPISDTYDIIALIKIVTNYVKGPIIFSIDEFTGLAYQSNLFNDVDELENVIFEIKNIPRCLLLLIGPHTYSRDQSPTIQEILTKSEPIEIQKLNKKDAKMLIKAEKLKPHHQIEISDEIFNTIYDMTGGNPYWLNLIAYEMWRLSQANRSSIIYDDYQIYKTALSRVLSQKSPFLSRTDYFKNVHKQIFNFIIKAPEGHAFSNIHVYLKTIYPDILESELEIFLEDMRAIGTINEIWNNDKVIWKVSSKILVEFINRYGFKKGKY
jgi:hypothetical protein